jgi:hypothetical protein
VSADPRRVPPATGDQEPSDLETRLAEILARGVSAFTRRPISSGFHDLSFALVEQRLARRNLRVRCLWAILLIVETIVLGFGAYRLGQFFLGRHG